MANLESSKKQARQNEKRYVKNLKRKTAIKTAVKKVLVGVESKTDITALTVLFNDAQAQLARAVSKNALHKNTVRRKISRLAKKISKLQRPG